MKRPWNTFSEEGSASVELAVLTPVVLVVLAVVIAGGRIVGAHAALDTATTAAARAASLARTAPAAHAAASTTARDTLAQEGLHCGQQALAVDTSGFDVPLGRTGSVAVRASCTVALADLALPAMPGSIPLHTEFTSPLDPFRGRT
ncbi:TadE/TadG family type IV pilus assembly protein [Saccharopolyspora sp. 6V]|uniref:TadE/TadG family type IV pilus assembly protein n=1 Tax=Saccharopolyspora sp. 6V TaxID=2877239 RepID=UPI001CD3F516|nr:TadE/TadG family type IV pilus assembly protein [Saccharopolyspora sp. 6V]MCA1192878.1 pilus assembly protein [Saccharopolyspora sp. 6V]